MFVASIFANAGTLRRVTVTGRGVTVTASELSPQGEETGYELQGITAAAFFVMTKTNNIFVLYNTCNYNNTRFILRHEVRRHGSKNKSGNDTVPFSASKTHARAGRVEKSTSGFVFVVNIL